MGLHRPLTRKFIATAPDGRHFDGRGNGLFLTVKGLGRSWMWRSEKDGKTYTLGLGPAGENGVDVDLARQRAIECMDLLHRQNIDPKAHRQEQRDQAEANRSRGQKLNVALDELWQRKWRYGVGAANIETYLNKWIRPVLGDVSIAALNIDMVMNGDPYAHKPRELGLADLWMKQHPTANAIKDILCTVVGHLKDARRIENLPFDRGYFSRNLPKPKVAHQRKKHPGVPFREAFGFLEQVRAVGKQAPIPRRGRQTGRRPVNWPVLALVTEFLLLTGVRVSEVLKAQWKEFDEGNKRWNVPRLHTKNKRWDRPLPITPSMAGVLHEMRRIMPGTGDDLVFRVPSGKKLRHQLLSEFHDRAIKTDYKFTTHGFRTTFQDWATAQKIWPAEWRAIQVDHQLAGMQGKHYHEDLLFPERQPMMEAYDKYCNMSPPKGDNLLTFPQTPAERSA